VFPVPLINSIGVGVCAAFAGCLQRCKVADNLTAMLSNDRNTPDRRVVLEENNMKNEQVVVF